MNRGDKLKIEKINGSMSGNCKGTFIGLWLMFASVVAFGQDFTATAKLDANTMLIGDQTNLSLSFQFPAQAQVQWPVIKDTILGYLPVLFRSKIDTTFSTDKKWVTLHQTLRITSFDSGLYTIPPVKFYFRQTPDTTLHYSQSEPLALYVHTVKVDTTQAIKPIKGIMKIPITFREILPWILLGVGVALLVWFVIYYLRKRKKAEPIFQLKPKVVIPAYRLALDELEKLKQKKLWQSGKIKEYHTEVTEIIRRYIEGQFDVMALESTTDEIIDGLKGRQGLPAGMMSRLNRLLSLADLVKFAKANPLPAENEQTLQDAFDFVNATIVRPEEQPAEIKET
jgi:hypothetical protein